MRYYKKKHIILLLVIGLTCLLIIYSLTNLIEGATTAGPTTTTPPRIMSAEECKLMFNQHKIVPGKSWGTGWGNSPSDKPSSKIQQLWNQSDCNNKIVASPEECRTMQKNFNVKVGVNNGTLDSSQIALWALSECVKKINNSLPPKSPSPPTTTTTPFPTTTPVPTTTTPVPTTTTPFPTTTTFAHAGSKR